MKIEIDTNDMLGDESTIREEVISQMVFALKKNMRDTINNSVEAEMSKAMPELVKEKVAGIVEIHLDTEFIPCDRHGREEKPTTIRKNIADIIQEQCIFKKTGYNSDNNCFTKAILSTVESELKKFKSEFMSLINTKVVSQCADEALKKLKAALGIKVTT